MKVFLLGATGRVGSHVLHKLVADKHEVHALVRSPHKIKRSSNLITVLKGDALRIQDIERAMEGCEAVISALNTDGSTVLSESTPLITAMMKKHGIKRIITVGTAGILQARSEPSQFRYLTKESKRKSTRAAEEHRSVYEHMKTTELEWTIVCPTYLPDGEEIGKYRVEKTFLPIGGEKISVPDTASFTYEQLFTDEFIHHRVGITY